MRELIFGTAGIPISTTERETLNGIARVHELGLGAMELEFVHSVNISDKKAPEVKAAAHKENVILTCHGQYYINLNAKEHEKFEASKKRVINAATRTFECGGWSTTFHPGFYLGQPKDEVYKKVKSALEEITQKLKDNGIKMWIRPETTGKPTQCGSLEEILNWSSEIEGILPCVDYAHMHSREGKYNTYEEFAKLLEMIEGKLGREALDNMHIQIAGVKYSEKGELSHLPLKESDLNYKDIVKSWKDFKVKGVVISESPNIEQDAMLLQRLYKEL
ncbi:TPA: TIM barrel protein [archaeon]|nr:TIM barrel protein [Candidatus Naiadarchaeales archaeon SRR2090153.bin461]HIK02771.1 TIM barrel protein [Candidatus Naiadarchaeales archaeon SRR2090159.bin1288]